MLKHKGIAFKRTDLFPVDLQARRARRSASRGSTVPAMKIDGRKVQGSREIARELDRLRPEPPLFPADPEKRAAVEEAERFGDEELQHPIRQIIWWALQAGQGAAAQLLGGRQAGHPDRPGGEHRGADRRPLGPLQRGDRRERPRRPRRAAAACCDRVDDLIAAGTLDGEELNAADFQIAPSIRLAMTFQDLRPLIEARPAGQLAKRVQPETRRRHPADPPARLAAAAAQRPQPDPLRL